jgi:hypothetical protein
LRAVRIGIQHLRSVRIRDRIHGFDDKIFPKIYSLTKIENFCFKICNIFVPLGRTASYRGSLNSQKRTFSFSKIHISLPSFFFESHFSTPMRIRIQPTIRIRLHKTVDNVCPSEEDCYLHVREPLGFYIPHFPVFPPFLI